MSPRGVSLYCRSAGVRIDTAGRGSQSLEKAELELCGVRHPVPIPRRIPDDIDLHVGYFGDFRDALLDLTWQELSGRTCRRRQSHPNTDRPCSVDDDVHDET